MSGTVKPLTAVAGGGIDAVISSVDWVIVGGLIVGLIGGSLWRAEDARSGGWKAFIESIIGSGMRFITFFIIAGASYEILIKVGSLFAVPFTPGPAGAGTIGMIIGVTGEGAFEWFMTNILNRPPSKKAPEPKYASPPEQQHDEIEDLARTIEKPRKRPVK